MVRVFIAVRPDSNRTMLSVLHPDNSASFRIDKPRSNRRTRNRTAICAANSLPTIPFRAMTPRSLGKRDNPIQKPSFVRDSRANLVGYLEEPATSHFEVFLPDGSVAFFGATPVKKSRRHPLRLHVA
jgi:hypothetical protein